MQALAQLQNARRYYCGFYSGSIGGHGDVCNHELDMEPFTCIIPGGTGSSSGSNPTPNPTSGSNYNPAYTSGGNYEPPNSSSSPFFYGYLIFIPALLLCFGLMIFAIRYYRRRQQMQNNGESVFPQEYELDQVDNQSRNMNTNIPPPPYTMTQPYFTNPHAAQYAMVQNPYITGMPGNQQPQVVYVDPTPLTPVYMTTQ